MMALLILLSTYTGIVLAPIAFLAVASGYCMKSPQLIGLLTIGVLGDYNTCSEIHTIIVPELLSLLGAIHALSTAEILARKYSGLGKVITALLNLYRASAWVLTLITITIVLAHTTLL
jgi:hypothetical protein